MFKRMFCWVWLLLAASMVLWTDLNPLLLCDSFREWINGLSGRILMEWYVLTLVALITHPIPASVLGLKIEPVP